MCVRLTASGLNPCSMSARFPAWRPFSLYIAVDCSNEVDENFQRNPTTRVTQPGNPSNSEIIARESPHFLYRVEEFARLDAPEQPAQRIKCPFNRASFNYFAGSLTQGTRHVALVPRSKDAKH